jgi:hypothetical protein
MSVRWGILSTARINGLVLDGARKSDRVEVAAVASRDAARADSYAREHGIERSYGSYEALLEDLTGCRPSSRKERSAACSSSAEHSASLLSPPRTSAAWRSWTAAP